MTELQRTLLSKVYAERGPLLDRINEATPWLAQHRARTLELLEPHVGRTTRVLDMAAGTGIFAAQLAPRVAALTLVDLLPSMLELARAKLESVEGHCRFDLVVADVAADDAVSAVGEYDVALFTQAANFFPDLSAVFEFAARRLRPGGVFHFDVDTLYRWIVVEALSGNVQNAVGMAQSSKDQARHVVGADYYFHGIGVVRNVLASAGFDLFTERAVGSVASLLHVFNASAAFLTPTSLDPRARFFTHPEAWRDLDKLDRLLEELLPPTVGGWTVFQATKR